MAEATNPITTASNPRVGALERVRHLKRGTEYEVLDRKARLQTDKPLGDDAEVVVYRSAAGMTWVRPVSEMDDGRFEAVASAPSPEAGAGGDLGELVSAAWELLHACEADMETHDPTDADDEPVGASESGPTAVQFGHMRRLRKALLAYRSGKLVASTGSEEETKGAEWLPIETAPRTFQPILLDLGRGKHGDIARAPVIGVWSDFCGGWAFWGAPKVPVSPQPIRWHVLPSPHEAPSDAPSTPEADR